MTPAEEHDMRIECAERLARVETRMAAVCKKLDGVLRALNSIQTANTEQSVDIAVLKTKAALYGSIAAIIISPVVAIAIRVLFGK